MDFKVTVDNLGHTIISQPFNYTITHQALGAPDASMKISPIQYVVRYTEIGPQGPAGAPGGSVSNLGALADIAFTSLNDGETIVYDVYNNRWRNRLNILDNLNDVVVATPIEGQGLVYEAATGLWKNKAVAGGSANLATNTGIVQASKVKTIGDEVALSDIDLANILQVGSMILGEVTDTFLQGDTSISIGANTEGVSQGKSAIGIGTHIVTQADNSVAINASETPLSPPNTGFFVKPIRQTAMKYIVSYDPTTGELTYSPYSSYTNEYLLAQINNIRGLLGLTQLTPT